MQSLISSMLYSKGLLIKAVSLSLLVLLAFTISTLIHKLLKGVMLSELKKTRDSTKIPLERQAKTLRMIVFWYSLALGVGCFFLLKRPVLGLFGLVIGPSLFKLWTVLSRQFRTYKFDQEMLLLLISITGMVRAGLTLPTAFELVGIQENNKLAQHMGRYLIRFRSGQSFQEVLGSFRKRAGLNHSSLMLQLLGVAELSGVGVANLLEEMTAALRSTLEMERRIGDLRRSVSMQGAFACVLPWGTLLLLWCFQRELLKPFFSCYLSFFVIGFCFLFQVVGGAVLWRISRFR